MNIVLYTRDFEPITILDLPVWLIEQMEKQGRVRIAVQEPPTTQWMMEADPTTPHQPKTVVLECYRLRWSDGSQKPIIVTQDDELALTLRPDWLPGQRASINNYKQTINNLVYMLKKAMNRND